MHTTPSHRRLHPRAILSIALFSLALSPLALLGQTFVSSSTLRIVTSDTIVRPAALEFDAGWNVNWKNFQEAFWDTGAQTPNPEVVSYLQANMSGMRYRYPGGTVANSFDWSKTIGPVANRTAQLAGGSYLFPYFGVDEFFAFLSQVGGTPMLVVNMLLNQSGTPLSSAEITQYAQLAAGWVEYCNAPNNGSNPGGGTDWAAVRAANGHPAPYNVMLWELGNETDFGANAIALQDYISRCQLFISAMLAIDPTIKFLAHSSTALEQAANWPTWHDTVLDNLGGSIAVVAAHPYYDGIKVPTKLASLSTIRSSAIARVPTNPPTVVATEHAKWDGADTGHASSIVGAIATSDFLMGAAQREGISQANMHVLAGTGRWQAFSYVGTPAAWQARPVTVTHGLMNSALRSGDVLASTIYTPNASVYSGGYDVRAAVVRKAGGGGYSIGFVNRHTSSYSAQIEIAALPAGTYNLTTKYLTDPSLTSVDESVILPLQTATSTVTVTSANGYGIFTVNLSAKSAGTLELTTISNPPPTVALTSPAANATFVLGENVPLAATASDANGIALVEFYRGGTTFIADDTTSPYTVSWSPASIGSYLLTAVAHDGGTPFASATSSAVPISVATNSVPSITTTTLPDGAVGTAYSQTLAATGGNGTLTWSLASGILPSGLSLSSGGVISGTPTAVGTSNFTVRVADSDGITGAADEDTQALGLTVASSGPATYAAESASFGGGCTLESNWAGYNGTGYINFPGAGGFLQFNNVDGGVGGSFTLTFRYALGATGSRTGLLIVNGVSQNITFSPSGAWTTWNTHNVTVTLASGATNTIRLESNGQDLANIDELTSAATNSVPSITTASLPGGTVGTAYGQTLTATGGDGALAWSLAAGTLPAGLALSSAGVISGTPTAAGTSNFSVRVADADGFTGASDEDTQALSITLASAPTTYAAESASFGGGSLLQSTWAGYNGTGYINPPTSGGFLQFNNVEGGTGGSKTISFRHALGATAARTGLLIVNGVAQNITFQPSGAWDTWANHSVTVTLTGGATNTIRLESNGQDLANMDELTVP